VQEVIYLKRALMQFIINQPPVICNSKFCNCSCRTNHNMKVMLQEYPITNKLVFPYLTPLRNCKLTQIPQAWKISNPSIRIQEAWLTISRLSKPQRIWIYKAITWYNNHQCWIPKDKMDHQISWWSTRIQENQHPKVVKIRPETVEVKREFSKMS
jgi:hypothetical protein